MKKTILFFALWLVGACAFAQTDQPLDEEITIEIKIIVIEPVEIEPVEIEINGEIYELTIPFTDQEMLDYSEELSEEEKKLLEQFAKTYDLLGIKSDVEFCDFAKAIILDIVMEYLTAEQREMVIEQLSDDEDDLPKPENQDSDIQ